MSFVRAIRACYHPPAIRTGQRMAKKRASSSKPTSKGAPKAANAPKRAPKAASSQRDSLHMLIVEARYYLGIADELLSGAKKTLDEAGCTHDIITVPEHPRVTDT